MPHAEIPTHQAKHTLIQHYAALTGKILDNKKKVEGLWQAMVAIGGNADIQRHFVSPDDDANDRCCRKSRHFVA